VITIDSSSDDHYQHFASINDGYRNKKYTIEASGEYMSQPIINDNKTLAVVSIATGDFQYFYTTVAIIDLVNAKHISTIYFGQGQPSIKFASDDLAIYCDDYRYEIIENDTHSKNDSREANFYIIVESI
jgi:hypothetical protein